jgi:riboflavin kinase/FMN adenylyltransferase
MRVLRGTSTSAPGDTVLTIGNFDGVHLGHRALLAHIATLAQEHGAQPAVLTFEPHPREFFAPASAPTRLSTLREKLELIAAEGVALTCVARFNRQFAALTAEQFIEQVLVRCLRVKHLVIGDDFCFGAGRKGDYALLQQAGAQLGFSVETLDSVVVHGERVSSSGVREALAAGDMERAARLLGRPYGIDGRVVHGQKLGRQIGFATANIRVKHDPLPLSGVFAVQVEGLGDRPLPGVANLGMRPTVGGASRPLLEVHLFDFDGDIYGRHLSVRFRHKLRSEIKFANFDELRAQIARDAEAARSFFQL